MVKLKRLWGLLAMIMVAMLSISVVSCGDDDDNDDYQNPYEDYSGGTSEVKVNNNGHDYVDLGLSVYWATCNIGAYSPTSQGNKYAFGETSTKSEYTSSNYVGGSADVVKQNWGGDWRLPTGTELENLVDKCTWQMRTVSGVQVITATGPNGNSIDLPYYSYLSGGYGYVGWYWSSTSSSSTKAYCLRFSSADGTISAGTNNKYNGFLVRGVITNPNYSGSGGGSSGGGSSGGGGSSTESLYFTNFNFTATQTSVTVKFYTNERASSATIKYGENSASSSVSATITNKEISATIRGLKKGTKYYVKCTARNSSGSVTSDDYPVMTNY